MNRERVIGYYGVPEDKYKEFQEEYNRRANIAAMKNQAKQDKAAEKLMEERKNDEAMSLQTAIQSMTRLIVDTKRLHTILNVVNWQYRQQGDECLVNRQYMQLGGLVSQYIKQQKMQHEADSVEEVKK